MSMKYDKLSSLLDERSFRLCIAADAESFGDGGVSQVATKEFMRGYELSPFLKLQKHEPISSISQLCTQMSYALTAGSVRTGRTTLYNNGMK